MTLVVGSVMLGAVLQRVSGIGFAMVVAPFVVIALGPAQGVVLVQLCGLTAAALVLVRVARDVDWTAYLRLVPASVVGIAVGSVAVSRLPEAPAQVVTAGVLLVSLAVATLAGGARQVARGPFVMATVGASAGVMTSLAGVGGVALSVLGRVTQWEHRAFAATLQPYFLTISAVTVVARVLTDPRAWPPLPAAAWWAIAAAMAAGLALGEVAARRLSSRSASRAMLAIAWAGALLTLVDGLAGL
ncbi:hypothetical protein DDP54_03610 [Cellulomonas sp. WB94]|uniref:sulfite exporter TauE/SafE family protein n=1 Tax=Cellulomonas sp. WB94 TaxID=2173174 RepID=UPI000D57DBC6|nr:sulfite exporter TauE/SafE family protein [Cellulomonas sp. WB94]PVU82238.1 hypothetical protein DDP54_03610 [Cellulomonas sp. WB94]